MSLRTRIAALFLVLALSSAFCPLSARGQKEEDPENALAEATEEEAAQKTVSRRDGSSSIWDNPPESHRDLWRWCNSQPSLIEVTRRLPLGKITAPASRHLAHRCILLCAVTLFDTGRRDASFSEFWIQKLGFIPPNK